MARGSLSREQSRAITRAMAVDEPPAHWPGIPSLAPYEDPFEDDSELSELLMDEDLIAPEDDDSLHHFETLDLSRRQKKVPMNRRGAKNSVNGDLDRFLAETDEEMGGIADWFKKLFSSDPASASARRAKGLASKERQVAQQQKKTAAAKLATTRKEAAQERAVTSRQRQGVKQEQVVARKATAETKTVKARAQTQTTAARASTKVQAAEAKAAKTTAPVAEGGTNRTGMLPIMDANHNLREITKQLALLEDHLFQPNKRCADCIRKHLLTAEALAEEAVTLDEDGEHTDLTDGLADKIRDFQRMVLKGEPKEKIAQEIRVIRKNLSKASFGVVEKQAAAMPPSSAPTFRDAVGAFRRQLTSLGHTILNTRKSVYDGIGFQISTPADVPTLTGQIEAELASRYGIMVGADRSEGGKVWIWIAPDPDAARTGSAAVLDDEVPPEPVRGGDPAFGTPLDAARAAMGSRARAPRVRVTPATLAEAVAAFRTEWLGRRGIIDISAVEARPAQAVPRDLGRGTIPAAPAQISVTAVPGGGRGLPPAWYGWPIRVVNIRCNPGMRVALPLARRRLVGRHGVTAVGTEPNPAYRRGTLTPQNRLVAYVTGPEGLPEGDLLPKSYLGIPVVVRATGPVMGSLARFGADATRIVGSRRSADGLQGGDAVIYGYPRKENPEVFDWFRGTVMQVGDTFDKWTVEKIPQDGWIAVYDPKDDTSAWIPEERVVKVAASPISKTLAGVPIPRYDETKIDGALHSDAPFSERALILADLIQGVMTQHLGDVCSWAGLDPDLVASTGCRKDAPTKLTLAAITNAFYESWLNPDSRTVDSSGADAVGIFGLRSRSSAGAGMTRADRMNPITSTERVLEVLREQAPAAFKNLLLRDAKASVMAPSVGADGGVTAGEYAQAWTTFVQMPPNRQTKALLRAKTADALAAGRLTPETLVVPVKPGAAVPYRSLGDYAMARPELEAFRARWTANVPVGVTIHDAMRAEEAFMVAAKDLGQDGPAARASLRAAAAAWERLAIQTGELWPLARAAQASYDAKDVAGTYEALGLIVSRHPGSPWADVARKEMAKLERDNPPGALRRQPAIPVPALVIGGLGLGALVLGLAAMAGERESRRGDWWTSPTPPSFAQ